MKTTGERPRLVALFSDFGWQGPYLGQMTAVLAAAGVQAPVVNLMADAPLFDPRASAYLLAPLARNMPSGTLFLSVVDPGVGGQRKALLIATGTAWFVGPDNGLFSQVLRGAASAQVWCVDWRPERLSDSFHGRDLFAPVAASICNGRPLPLSPLDGHELVGCDWPDDLQQIIYIDHYGNAFTGIRGCTLQPDAILAVKGVQIRHARTFCTVPPATPFWYTNSQGLVEIAVNQGHAASVLVLKPGSTVVVR